LKAAHLIQGKEAEDACFRYLKTQGLKAVTRNYHCRHGEIDIIMMDGKVLVFIEVRFRKDNRYGDGLESITYHKQNKLRKTAEHFLQKDKHNRAARFDVVSMSNNTGSKAKYTFDWIRDAF
jgi:putative endonuclease